MEIFGSREQFFVCSPEQWSFRSVYDVVHYQYWIIMGMLEIDFLKLGCDFFYLSLMVKNETWISICHFSI